MKIKESYIDCGHCGMRFRCPFYIRDTKTFSHAIMWGNRVKCSLCEVTIDCDERNMSYILEAESKSQSGDTLNTQVLRKAEDCWAPV